MLQRLEEVELRIHHACERSGRQRENINLIAVTKYISAAKLKEVFTAGCNHIGENRWQDAASKWAMYGSHGIWHFIGHLQTNKVKDVVDKFTYIHSLDRISLAQEIDKRAAQLGINVNCFIQINVSGEATKYGLPPDKLHSFCRDLRNYRNLRIIGLMTMAPHEEAEKARPVFSGLRALRDDLNEASILAEEATHLSMGMSNDFEIAIEEGATWIRLGSILVGKE